VQRIRDAIFKTRMEKQELELLVSLYENTERQGPGGEEQTRLAISLSRLTPSCELKIADIGSGTGAASLVLADSLKAHVTAVDIIPSFLQTLTTRASKLGRLADCITTLECNMTDVLPFQHGELDAIWSEGAIYNIGFENGIREWRKYLKPHGILAVSELTWLTTARPKPLESYWKQEYSQVDTASAKISLLEKHGYTLLGYFVLPKHCWTENYYNLLQIKEFLKRQHHSEAARAVVEAQETEIDLYKEYSDYYGYGYYIAQRVED